MCRSMCISEGAAEGPHRPAATESTVSEVEFSADRLRFFIEPDPALHVLQVRAQGDLTANNVLQITRRIREFASKYDCTRVLCDYVQTRVAASILSIYENPACMEKEGLTRNMRFAVWYERDEKKHRFWETVLRNRGYMARGFRSRQDAVRWLLDARRY